MVHVKPMVGPVLQRTTIRLEAFGGKMVPVISGSLVGSKLVVLVSREEILYSDYIGFLVYSPIQNLQRNPRSNSWEL